jgi:hypothetical protein
LKGTFELELDILDGSGEVEVYFVEGSKAENFTLLVGTVTATGVGKLSVSATIPEEFVGASGILQVVYNSDEVFYQCADVDVTADSGVASLGIAFGTLIALVALAL